MKTRTILIIACLALAGCTTDGTSPKWYAPTTWFSHAPAEKADRAHVAAEQAAAKADDSANKAIHAAQVEFAKASAASVFLPPARSSDLVRRFLPNGLGLLDQVRPLTASESSEVREIVAGLMSDAAETVAAAEKKQRAAESDAARISRELEEARKEALAANVKADALDIKLRAAFDRENALANELRAQRWRFWIAVGVLVLVSGFALYAKIALGGVGAALHAAGAPLSVTSHIDSNLSTFGQWMIRTGRVAAAKAEAVLSTHAAK